MYLYVDGELQEYKSLTNFKFTNASVDLKAGPTENVADSFTIDAPAVYRYTLNKNQIKTHYSLSGHINPIQIVYPDEGTLISTSQTNQDYIYSYSYPANRPWKNFDNSDIYINEYENYVSLYKTATAAPQTVVLTDTILIPPAMDINASKIEWNGTNGVSVRVSNDGLSWDNCESGSALPMYIWGNSTFSSERMLYIEITLSSDDTSKYVPWLDRFNITFYKNKVLYAQNSGVYLSSKQPSGLSNNNNWDLDISSAPQSILSRNYNNGIRPQLPGFFVNSIDKVKAIEFFFTPETLSSGYLLSATTDSGPAYFSWASGGAVSKSKVEAIYINGVDRTSATNISTHILAGEPHHVFIELTDFASGDIWFNVKVDGSTWSNPLPRNLYQNIALYNKDFTSAEAILHYNLYTGNTPHIADDSSMSVTELEHFTYSNDWVAIKGR